MSGLSASTYSWGGEGARFGGGGEAGLAGFLGLKYFSKPILRLTEAAIVSSSVDGADESEDESELDMVLCCGRWLGGVMVAAVVILVVVLGGRDG